jgi:FkbM family methyltransferase
MPLTSKLSTLGKTVKIFLETRNISKAVLLGSWYGGGNSPLVREFDFENNGLWHLKSGNFFNNTLSLFNHDLELLEQCCREFNAAEKDGKLHLFYTVNKMQVEAAMENYESILCFDEIFFTAAYSFWFSSSCVVIDGGMNIGIASLYFASMEMVEAVYSFEIVQGSYNAACKNFLLNTQLNEKIHPFHSALGTQNGETEITFTGAGDVGANILEQNKPGIGKSKQRVTIKSTSEVVREVKQFHPNKKIVLKLDCEGSEYEIIRHLETTGTLKEIDCLLIEWHYRGSAEISHTLTRHGFTVFTPNLKASIPVGYIYASKC